MPILETLSAAQILLAVGALLLGAFVQGAVGFAYGLIATPLLLWAGLPLPEAVGAVGGAGLVQTATGCWKFRRHIVWRDLPGLAAGRTLGLPFGILVMAWLTAGGAVLMKQGVGFVVLGTVLLISLLRPKPRSRVSRRWVAPVGLSSGVMSGVTGIGGPPLVLWVVAHDWSTKRGRVFLWVLFLQLMPIQLALMWWKFGGNVGWAIGLGWAMAPGVIWATTLGAKLGSRWSRERMRRVILGVLVVLALASIASPWLG
ncbi:MAG: sulfite exporter TauE/SafE family protein [Planctomycetota bacterium]